MDQSWIKEYSHPLFIAGPCSAESEEQVLNVTRALKNQGINIIRAGIWKPRTRPNSFEGIGHAALPWLELAKKETGVKFAIEVANPSHVEQALKHNIDILWIGARSTVNPFTVQEIAESLKGITIPVLVKNPVNPDLALWIGAIERLLNQDIQKVGAIHRGFSSFGKQRYRNEPLWQIPVELKRHFPELPLICDPSHIGGRRDQIAPLSQKALDLNYDGLMIEVHPNPDKALSDAAQQVTPEAFAQIRQNLHVRRATSDNELFRSKLEELRERINSIDHDLVDTLAARQKAIEEIGIYKKENDVMVFQLERWNEIMRTRPEWASAQGLDRELIEEIYKLIHADSLKVQTRILNEETNDSAS
ncbi:bifunctional 3-deoxy-7-phosphoheptulonate synthase/chorismate mutase type II [Fulvivirga sedimenti]|uniref:chorismate mutase n=1 Tax=Fulvivirga sedimenti TaxID=2879465 RepID=A0A9X1HNB9_9BACT|nr:bifunctional 3-deoxy-7-phosphoheptulonate synthase/chorismate mutase type II [Fulvivirga sedimenti]MCA6074170.1 bifunctional 3-deoxy-7-phosphoheptulonate synthase/chorismate mutase type II [Fulvivirga sedimenti]